MLALGDRKIKVAVVSKYLCGTLVYKMELVAGVEKGAS